MKSTASILALSVFGVVAFAASADAGQRVVTRVSPNGGVMTTTRNCAPDLSTCQRATSATGAYGRTVAGSASIVRQPGQSEVTGAVVGPNGQIYNRQVIRNW